MNRNLSMFLTVLCTFLFITACSGGDDSNGGNDSAAEINEENKSQMSAAAAIGARRAISGNSATTTTGGIGFSRQLVDETLQTYRAGVASREKLNLMICTTGSAYIEFDEIQTSENGTFTIVYDNCKYDYGGGETAVDGTAEWTVNEDGSFTYKYDISITYAGETTRVTATYSCDSEANCSYEDSFAEGGTDYRITNVSVGGNNSSGFSVDARVYHEEYGYVEITGSGLILCESGGGFQSGTIDVSDSSGSVINIQFNNNCDNMTVTYNGVAEIVSQ